MKLPDIVFTVLALSGLGFCVACGPDPEERQAAQDRLAVRDCQLNAFVTAVDGVTLEGLSPDVIVASLPPETIVSISGSGEGRLRITRAVSLEGDVLFDSESASDSAAWLPAGAVATSSKALRIALPAANPQLENGGVELAELPDSEQPTVPIFADADGAAAPVARLTPDEAVNLLDCRGTWAYVSGTSMEGEAVNGWLAPEAQCPNPVTSCS